MEGFEEMGCCESRLVAEDNFGVLSAVENSSSLRPFVSDNSIRGRMVGG